MYLQRFLNHFKNSEREVLHLPETAHLYALLNCAQFNQDKYLEPELESYLIQTILRYSGMADDDLELLNDAVDLDIEDEQDQDVYLKEIGDYCLICTGLMSERFMFEEHSYERLQEVGQHAFAMLSDHEDNNDNIYLKLSDNFSSLVDVLQYSKTLMMNDHPSTATEDSTLDSVLKTTYPIKFIDDKSQLSTETTILYH